MIYVRRGFAQRLALELEAISWANGRGISTPTREDEGWAALNAQLRRMEARIAELEQEAGTP